MLRVQASSPAFGWMEACGHKVTGLPEPRAPDPAHAGESWSPGTSLASVHLSFLNQTEGPTSLDPRGCLVATQDLPASPNSRGLWWPGRHRQTPLLPQWSDSAPASPERPVAPSSLQHPLTQEYLKAPSSRKPTWLPSSGSQRGPACHEHTLPGERAQGDHLFSGSPSKARTRPPSL